jgi:GNAT superfamily N-acetyltransferase
MRLRPAQPEDDAFVLEMARLACVIEQRPLPAADDPSVVALLPAPNVALIAQTPDERRVGAAWWVIHEPPLLRGEDGAPLPELVMAVLEGERGRGVGTALVEGLAARAAAQHPALVLNVHIRNPAARLYSRTGFTVVGAGRGPLGVAMRRPLRAEAGATSSEYGAAVSDDGT